MQYTSLSDFECNLHFVAYLLFALSFYYHLLQHIPLTVDVGCLSSPKFMLKRLLLTTMTYIRTTKYGNFGLINNHLTYIIFVHA